MAKLVYRGWSLFEALRLVDRAMLGSGKIERELREYLGHFDSSLSVDKVEREVIDPVIKGDSFPTSGSVDIVNGSCTRKRSGKFEIFQRVHDPCRSSKDILVAFAGTVQEWLCAIAAIVYLIFRSLSDTKSKVQKELVSFFEVLVRVVHVGNAVQIDLLEHGRYHYS